MKTCFTKCFHFSASHRLWDDKCSDSDNLDKFGKCSAVHGHNFELHVTLSGEPAESTGMIIPADELESLVQELVVKNVDHRHLNDLEILQGLQPTTENFARCIWNVLEPAIDELEHTAQLEKVLLWETPKIYASVERSN